MNRLSETQKLSQSCQVGRLKNIKDSTATEYTQKKNVSSRPFPISPTSFISFVLWCLVFCQSVFESIFRMGSNEEMSLVAADMAAVKFTEIDIGHSLTTHCVFG